jgi:preprotein translocase subunit SecD
MLTKVARYDVPTKSEDVMDDRDKPAISTLNSLIETCNDQAQRSDRHRGNPGRLREGLFNTYAREHALASSSLAARVVYIHDVRVLTNNDVVEARMLPDRGTFAVALTLTSEGAEKISLATRSHTGKPLAIIVDGVVEHLPT